MPHFKWSRARWKDGAAFGGAGYCWMSTEREIFGRKNASDSVYVYHVSILDYLIAIPRTETAETLQAPFLGGGPVGARGAEQMTVLSVPFPSFLVHLRTDVTTLQITTHGAQN